MSLVELLVLLALVFFPLLQALLEKMGVGRREETLPEPQESAADPPVATMERPRPAAKGRLPETTAEEGAWSAGWGEWPVETLEDLSEEEVVTEEEADELIAYQEQLAERGGSEAARVTVPVVSMEPLVVDRSAEHRRFHERVMPPPPPRPRQPGQALDGVLRHPAALRQAIILSEVLGPPRALKPVEPAPTDLR